MISLNIHQMEARSNDFTNKTMNISRHFNSNKLMREKIVEFDVNKQIPQVEKQK